MLFFCFESNSTSHDSSIAETQIPTSYTAYIVAASTRLFAKFAIHEGQKAAAATLHATHIQRPPALRMALYQFKKSR